jgi:30S ribosomal protein S31
MRAGVCILKREENMGKGDKRSRKGKIFAGSYGKSRPKHKKKATAGDAASTSAAPKRTTTRKKKAE